MVNTLGRPQLFLLICLPIIIHAEEESNNTLGVVTGMGSPRVPSIAPTKSPTDQFYIDISDPNDHGKSKKKQTSQPTFAPTGVGETRSPTQYVCANSPNFIDAMNYDCNAWIGLNCYSYVGYSQAELFTK